MAHVVLAKSIKIAISMTPKLGRAVLVRSHFAISPNLQQVHCSILFVKHVLKIITQTSLSRLPTSQLLSDSAARP